MNLRRASAMKHGASMRPVRSRWSSRDRRRMRGWNSGRSSCLGCAVTQFVSLLCLVLFGVSLL